MNYRRIADNLGIGIFHATLLFALAFAVLPLAVGMILSFDARDYIASFPPSEFSLRWYSEFFENSSYLRGLEVSIIVAVLATAISVGAGVPAAIFLERSNFVGRDALQMVFLSPLIIPTVVTGFGILIFAAQLGVVDGMTRLVAGHLIITLPYVIRATLAGLVGIPRGLEEAAMSLGATQRQAFVEITLPLARAGIIAGAVFAFAMSFDEVAISLFLSDPFTYTLPVALLAEMRANLNLTVAAVSTVLIIFTAVLIFALDRLIGIDRVIGQGMYRS